MLIRGTAVVLGLALLVLWVVALAALQPAWITWLDFAAGAIMLLQSALSYRFEAGMSLVLSLGLFSLFIIALAVGGVAPWLTWVNLGFAAAFLLFTFYAAYGMRHPEARRPLHAM